MTHPGSRCLVGVFCDYLLVSHHLRKLFSKSLLQIQGAKVVLTPQETRTCSSNFLSTCLVQHIKVPRTEWGTTVQRKPPNSKHASTRPAMIRAGLEGDSAALMPGTAGRAMQGARSSRSSQFPSWADRCGELRADVIPDPSLKRERERERERLRLLTSCLFFLLISLLWSKAQNAAVRRAHQPRGADPRRVWRSVSLAKPMQQQLGGPEGPSSLPFRKIRMR